MKPDRYSLNYRSAEASQVMGWIKARQCGCVLGLRGAGKSNFLRFLLRPDVQEQYLGQDHANTRLMVINLLLLSEHSEWGVYEMIFAGMLAELTLSEIETHAGEIGLLQQGFARTRDGLQARRAVERLAAILCQSPERQIVLFFDEFDAAFRDLPAMLFRALRAIRDAHTDQIAYIVLTAHDLADLRDDTAEEVEHFYRLVTRNTCSLGPYQQADTHQMIGYLASQRSIELSKKDTGRLAELSGGHAGLLKAIIGLLWNSDDNGDLAKLEKSLEDQLTIQRECGKVWTSLAATEQAGLCSLANEEWLDPHTLHGLIFRGVLQNADTPKFFSPLFQAFVRQQAPPPTTGTFIRRSPRFVQIDGRYIDTLTELEFEALCYLYERRGQVCTKDSLAEHVYHRRYNDLRYGVSDETLQTLISRLRQKIEPKSQPRCIVTVRGEGYRFVEPKDSKE